MKHQKKQRESDHLAEGSGLGREVLRQLARVPPVYRVVRDAHREGALHQLDRVEDAEAAHLVEHKPRLEARRLADMLMNTAFGDLVDTAVLLAQPPLWTPGVGDAFDATITLRVPSQLTSRTPGLFEALKLAFVQYIAMLIPIGALLTCLHGALFRTGVLAARMHHPIKQHHF